MIPTAQAQDGVALLMLAVLALAGCTPGGAAPAESGPAPNPTRVGTREMVRVLTRNGVGSEGRLIAVTYTPIRFFELTGLQAPAELVAHKALAFFMEETVYDGELSDSHSAIFLESPAGERIPPTSYDVTAEDPHHRTIRLLFPWPAWWASPIDIPADEVLRAVVLLDDGRVSVGSTFEWRLPIELGAAIPQRDSPP